MKLTQDEKNAQKLIISEIDKSMTLLRAHLEKFYEDTGANSVPIIYINQSIKLLLEGYKKGIDGK